MSEVLGTVSDNYEVMRCADPLCLRGDDHEGPHAATIPNGEDVWWRDDGKPYRHLISGLFEKGERLTSVVAAARVVADNAYGTTPKHMRAAFGEEGCAENCIPCGLVALRAALIELGVPVVGAQQVGAALR